MWSTLCDPIAEKAVDALGGMISGNPEELGGEMPAELNQALQAVTGGLGGMAGLTGGLGAMMKRIGGMMVGGQTGAAIGGLAREVVSSTDVGLPLGPEGVAALLPAGVADFGQGLSISAEEIRIFLALREAAHHRLFAHVPWLRSRLLAAVEDYARGITVDASALREAMPQIDPSNPDALREALSDASLFQPEDTPQQKAALARLETLLALVEGWVATVVEEAAGTGCRRPARWPRPSGGAGPPAGPPSRPSPRWSGWNCGRGGCARRPTSGGGSPTSAGPRAGTRCGPTRT